MKYIDTFMTFLKNYSSENDEHGVIRKQLQNIFNERRKEHSLLLKNHLALCEQHDKKKCHVDWFKDAFTLEELDELSSLK